MKQYLAWRDTGDEKTDAQCEAWLTSAGWQEGD